MSNPNVMTKDEREAFLAALHVGVLAVNEPDRAPLAVPVWYRYEPGGNVEFITSGSSRKMVDINAAGRFSLCVQTESAPYKYVTVEGPVQSVQPMDHEADLVDIAVRYLGEQGGREYAGEPSPDSDSVLVSMEPQRWLSIDYGKS